MDRATGTQTDVQWTVCLDLAIEFIRRAFLPTTSVFPTRSSSERLLLLGRLEQLAVTDRPARIPAYREAISTEVYIYREMAPYPWQPVEQKADWLATHHVYASIIITSLACFQSPALTQTGM